MQHREPRRRYKDVSGIRFGRLVALAFVGTDKTNNARWLFQCDCGKQKQVLLRHVRKGLTRSCGCLHREIVRNMLMKESGLSSLNRIIGQYRADARRRNQVFDLNLEETKELTKAPCFYCGKQPEQIRGGVHYNGYYTYNGLDRLNVAEGYTITNTVTACRQCNFAKGTLLADEFLAMVKRIYHYKRLNNENQDAHTI